MAKILKEAVFSSNVQFIGAIPAVLWGIIFE